MTADAAEQSGHEIPDALSQIPLPRDASFDSGPYQRHGIGTVQEKGAEEGARTELSASCLVSGLTPTIETAVDRSSGSRNEGGNSNSNSSSSGRTGYRRVRRVSASLCLFTYLSRRCRDEADRSSRDRYCRTTNPMEWNSR
jgi:hypothetical protein